MPPFSFFGTVRLFFQNFFFTKSAPPIFFDDLPQNGWEISPLVRQFGSTFGFFRYRRREYFDTLKSFAAVEENTLTL